jgi:tetratricopeptide (TPR) repeat protein
MIRRAFFALVLCCVSASTQTSLDTNNQDLSKEGVVIERSISKFAFQSDGTYTFEQMIRTKMQSDSGVRQYGVLSFPYQSSAGVVEVEDVRVTKTNGTVVVTPLDSIQDVTSEINRVAPLYSDSREKHVVVKGLELGDVLEYSARWKIDKPLIPGQFWINWQFMKYAVVLDDQLEISVPRNQDVKVKSRSIQPAIRNQSDRVIYSWKTSNLQSQSLAKQSLDQRYEAIHGVLPPADVMVSTFSAWDDIGRWYQGLQQEKIKPTPEIKAKAEQLTKGLSNDDAKLRAIYNYVSLQYRYVAISFGIGRYQPHSATEVLGNYYGDCKDKHTLLAALLDAAGIRAYPALINSRLSVDTDVPSPAQFDHIITVVPQGQTFLWMDTTTEVAPFGYLLQPLRGKPALVIMPEKFRFETTPVNSPLGNRTAGLITARIGPDGTLQAHVQFNDRGDAEIYYRNLFRRVPEAQWKDVGQQLFYGGKLGGIITNVQTSAPEKTEQDFEIDYYYSLKDFTHGNAHRLMIPLPPFALPAVKDEDLNRKSPFWIGNAGEQQFESHLELPKEWTLVAPPSTTLKESFAEFQDSSELREGVLVTRRRLTLKTDFVTPDQLASYRTFQKAVWDDFSRYFPLVANLRTRPAITPVQGIAYAAQLLPIALAELPNSSNAQAVQLEQGARKSMQAKDYTSAISLLKQAIAADPTFSRAWVALGATYYWGNRDVNSALAAFQKAVDANDKEALPCKILAFMYMGIGKQDEAIAAWLKVKRISPEDHDLTLNLGELYLKRRRFPDAISLYEFAAQKTPSEVFLQLRLGMAHLRNKDLDQGIHALHKAAELDSSPEMLNEVAFEMSEASAGLTDALSYSQRAVNEAEQKSLQVNLDKPERADFETTQLIAAYWDTLGWVYFKMGDLASAESYLDSAWQLGQDGLVGDHLGQLYEKQGKGPAALLMYTLSLAANPQLQATQSRIRNLSQVSHSSITSEDPQEELKRMRTLTVSAITKETANADFNLLLLPNGKLEKVVFLRGSESLRNAGDSLDKVQAVETFPAKSVAHLLRQGNLSCVSGNCNLVLSPPRMAVSSN